jgi:hypothetical protein
VKAEDAEAGAERNYPSGEPKENRERKERNVQAQERRIRRSGQRFDGRSKRAVVATLEIADDGARFTVAAWRYSCG